MVITSNFKRFCCIVLSTVFGRKYPVLLYTAAMMLGSIESSVKLYKPRFILTKSLVLIVVIFMLLTSVYTVQK